MWISFHSQIHEPNLTITLAALAYVSARLISLAGPLSALFTFQ